MYVLGPNPVGRQLGGAQLNAEEAATCADRWVDYASNGDDAGWAAATLEEFALLGCLLAYAAHLQPQWRLFYSDWLGDTEGPQCCAQTMGKAAL